MYEELIERLREYPDREETAGGYVEIDWQDLLDAADAIGSLTDQLAAIQAGKAELRDEIRCLRHNVAAMQATLDQQAKNCEKLLAEKDKRIACVEAERDKLLDRAHEARVERDCARAERDAAIADISHVCPTCGQFQGGDCPVLFYKDYPKDCEHWRWRGVQGEG